VKRILAAARAEHPVDGVAPGIARPVARSYNPLSNAVIAINASLSTITARIADLWTQWDRYFPRRPVKPNRAFIESRIAYKIQEQAFGAHSFATHQRLETIGAQHSKIKLRARPREFDFVPGTVLLR
jgi:hypothetical protein